MEQNIFFFFIKMGQVDFEQSTRPVLINFFILFHFKKSFRFVPFKGKSIRFVPFMYVLLTLYACILSHSYVLLLKFHGKN